MNNLTSETELGGITCKNITEAIERLARFEKMLAPFTDEKDLEYFLNRAKVTPYKFEVDKTVWAITVYPKFNIYELQRVTIKNRKRRISEMRGSDNVYTVENEEGLYCDVSEQFISKTSQEARGKLALFRKQYKFKGGKK